MKNSIKLENDDGWREVKSGKLFLCGSGVRKVSKRTLSEGTTALFSISDKPLRGYKKINLKKSCSEWIMEDGGNFLSPVDRFLDRTFPSVRNGDGFKTYYFRIQKL